MYVGQLAEKEPCLEAKFYRPIRNTSTFHWPVVKDKSVINENEIFMHSPSPIVERKKRENVTFIQL